MPSFRGSIAHALHHARQLTQRSPIELATLVGVIATLVGVLIAKQSLDKAAISFDLQSRAFAEDSYQRYQSALSLASKTIGEANNIPYDVGQSDAVRFLARSNRLQGHLVLNKSKLFFGHFQDEELYRATLSNSSLCGTEIVAWNFMSIELSGSQLRAATLRGSLDAMRAIGADMRGATIADAYARNTKFIGSIMKGVTFEGGLFKYADFQGADLSGARTERGLVGLGTNEGTGIYGNAGYVDYVDYVYSTVMIGKDDDFKPIFAKKYSAVDALELVGIKFRGAPRDRVVDFTGAHFDYADLRGADLRNSNITQDQINTACTDEATQLPDKSMRRSCVVEPWVSDLRDGFQGIAASDQTMVASCTAALQVKAREETSTSK